MQMQPQPQHKTNPIITIGASVLVGLLVYLSVGYFMYAHTNTPQVTPVSITQVTKPAIYITKYVFNYNCSNCASPSWSYTAPAGLYLDVNSSYTEQDVFGPYSVCVYVTNVYSVTPGFTVTMHPLPLYVPVGQNITVTLTLVAPSHGYYGQVVINITQSLC